VLGTTLFLKEKYYINILSFLKKNVRKGVIRGNILKITIDVAKLPSLMDKVTIFHEKCHSLYIKELFKLLLPGLDIVIISLDDLVVLISPDF
jgi:hypothetical protein